MKTNRSTKTRSACRGLKIHHITLGVFCFTLGELFTFTNIKNRQLYEQSSGNNSKQGTTSSSSSSSFILESFAISFDQQEVEILKERNKHANLGKVHWERATDGLNQQTLDYWTQLTNHQHPPMTVEEASNIPKGNYDSPHAVGVYLAHWNLLRSLAHRPVELQYQPEKKHAYLILEEDATCAPGLNEEIERTIDQLPSDWDMLFVGGKPFSYFENITMKDDDTTKKCKQLINDYKQHGGNHNWTALATTNRLLRQSICQGDFGKASGPLAPDGSRRLSQNDRQAYWRVNYLTNTHSYIVNPQRVAHVAKLLHPSMDVPIDIRLGDLMKTGELNAYITTRMWCDQMSTLQQQEGQGQLLLAPQPWKGYFVFVMGNDWDYLWQTQMHMDDENCAF